MAFVWNIMLSFDNEELWEDGEDEPRETCRPLDHINQWIPHGKLVDLTGPTFVKGAGFGMDANLYGGGFKHFDIEGFIEVVKSQAWKERAKVQIWIRGAEEGMAEEPFTAIELGPSRTSRRKRKSRSAGKTSSRATAKRRRPT